MSSQRSILSFFQSNSKQQQQSQQQPPQQPSFQPIAPRPPPPGPPPPSLGKFVPPPSSPRNNAISIAPPPPSTKTVVRSGGSQNPPLELAPITTEFATAVLEAAGAEPTTGNDNNNNTTTTTDLAFPSPFADIQILVPRDVHLPDLVSVNAVLLPVRYSDSFYRDVADRTRVASLFNRVLVTASDGKVVGGIVCRLEASPFNTNGAAVYVQSLGVLAPYRSRGLAAAALESIVATAMALNARRASGDGSQEKLLPPIHAVYAHVWTEHDDALRWYERRQFVRQGTAPVAGYYHALRPDTAWVVRRDLGGVVAALGAASSTASVSGSAPKTATRPKPSASLSFQNARPQTEWNDLPDDMVVPSASASASASASVSAASSRNASRRNLAALNDGSAPPPPSSAAAAPTPSQLQQADAALLSPGLAPPPAGGGASSQASSRSSSAARKKRDRTYPAAMFGKP